MELSLQPAQWATLLLIRVFEVPNRLAILPLFQSSIDSFFPSAWEFLEMHIKQAFSNNWYKKMLKRRQMWLELVHPSLSYPDLIVLTWWNPHFALQWAPQIILGRGDGGIEQNGHLSYKTKRRYKENWNKKSENILLVERTSRPTHGRSQTSKLTRGLHRQLSSETAYHQDTWHSKQLKILKIYIGIVNYGIECCFRGHSYRSCSDI